MSQAQRMLEIGRDKAIIREMIATNKREANAAIESSEFRKAEALLDKCAIYHEDLQALTVEANLIYEDWGI